MLVAFDFSLQVQHGSSNNVILWFSFEHIVTKYSLWAMPYKKIIDDDCCYGFACVNFAAQI